MAHIIGVKVSETMAEITMVTDRVMANSRNRRPTISPINSNGISTAMSEMVSATIEFNSTTTAGYIILPLLQSVNINGVTQTRVALALYNSSGSAIAWNTTNIPSSDIIQINVMMDISN